MLKLCKKYKQKRSYCKTQNFSALKGFAQLFFEIKIYKSSRNSLENNENYNVCIKILENYVVKIFVHLNESIF